MSMKTIMRGLVVALSAALGLNAWAETTVWSNLTSSETSIEKAGNVDVVLCLQPTADIPAASTVKLTKIAIADRPDRDSTTPVYKITVAGTEYYTNEREAGEPVEVNSGAAEPVSRGLSIYTFPEGSEPVVTVGMQYVMTTHNADHTSQGGNRAGASCAKVATPATSGILWWNGDVSTRNGWNILGEITGEVVSLPARDPENFAFDAATQTWTPSTPTEFLLGDTVTITGEGDATLSMDVPCALTVGSGVNLTISGDVNISGVSKFESGSTLTIVSGTTTISNAQDGTNGNRGLMGTVIVKAGATLALPKNDSINYSDATEMHVKGTLALGTNRQSLRAHNKLYVYPGSSITGNGDGSTALDFVDGSEVGLTVVDDAEIADKTATISAVVRNNNAANNILIDVPTGMTLTMSGVIKQGVPKKLGAGDLILSGANTFTKLEVAAGMVKNGKTDGIPSGLGAFSGGNQCDNLSLITVAEGAKLDVANIAGNGYGSCYRVELAGELTNTGADMGTDWRQLSKITVTGDNAKITGNTESLLCSGWAATKIELGEHTLEIALNANKVIHLRTTTISGTGTIKITSGQLHITTGTSLAEETDITVLLAEGATFDDGLLIFPEANVKALDSVNNKIVKNGCVYSTAARDVATTIYVTSNTSTFVDAEGNSINPIAADTIVVDSHCTIGQWGGGINLSQIPACAKLVLNRHMDAQGGIAAGSKVEVSYKEGNDKGIYLRGDIGEGATITGEGNLFVGHANKACSVGNGVSIACNFGIQSNQVTNNDYHDDWVVTINGTVTVTGTIYIHTGNFKLADDASLVTTQLDEDTEAKIISGVSGKHVEYLNNAYVLVADTPSPTVPEVIDENASPAQKTAYAEWAAANGVSGSTTSKLADAFAIGATGTDEESVLEAAEDKLETTLLAKIDLDALAGEGGVVAAVAALNAEYVNATFTLVDVPQSEIATTASLYRLTVSFKPANSEK